MICFQKFLIFFNDLLIEQIENDHRDMQNDIDLFLQC